MNSLLKMLLDMNKQIGIELPADWQKLPDIESAKRIITNINRYFYQTRKDIGEAQFYDEYFYYISEFHKFWEAYHPEILNASIDEKQVSIAAKAFHRAVKKYGESILNITRNTCGLPKSAVAKVRFFTANQDFRMPPEEEFSKYLEDPSQFDTEEIDKNPEGFLSFLGITRLSQNDKRAQYARNAARFLIKNKIDAFSLAEHFGNDAVRIREALIETPNIGYGEKKANMFIRDMLELGVWTNLGNYEEIDVASDINTMKLALRTRIIKTDITLISSFLDIFCHQYGYIDKFSAKGWREVWKAWHKQNPETVPVAPCSFDFILYRIGKEYCKDNLCKYRCSKGHEFYYFEARLSKCRECGENVEIVSRCLPCQVPNESLPREDGILLIKEENLLRTFNGHCVLQDVCRPSSDEFRLFDPPKSISIKGQTGWTTAYAEENRGGGGLMS